MRAKPSVVYFSEEYTTHDRRFLECLAPHYAVHHLQLAVNRTRYTSRRLPTGVRRLSWSHALPELTPETVTGLLPELEKILRKVRPRLIQCGPLDSCAAMVGALDCHPSLVVSWGADVLAKDERRLLAQCSVRDTIRNSDALLCDSKAVERLLRPMVPYASDRLLRIPWGVDLATTAPDPRARLRERRRLGWESNNIIVSARAWHPGYGIDTVVGAFAAAADADPSLRLVLLGSGEERSQVESMIQELGLANKVSCPGQVAEKHVLSAMQAADAYLCCTPTDGSSVTLLQAMALNLPVVVTDNAGNREWVKEPANGFLAEAGEPLAFARAISKLFAIEPRDRARIGVRSRQRIESDADWSVNSARLLSLYRQFVS